MRIVGLIFLFVVLISSKCFSQLENIELFSPAIEDNSMFSEEAYNQEDRVVQHIFNYVLIPNLKDNYFISFTQEWPVFGLKHQLSYTLQYNSFDKDVNVGFGDVMINYRYQLSYKENYVACSPRLSVIFPTGNKNKGLGSGSWGFQLNLPVSKRWTNHFVNHFNLGATYFYKIKEDEINYSKSLVNYFAGISSIWLISEKFNLMFEAITNMVATPGLNNTETFSNITVVAPAIRYAIQVNKLQIVPGISVPITYSENSKAEVGAFFYLSFEHEY